MVCIFKLFSFIYSYSNHLKSLIGNHEKYTHAINRQADVTIHDNKLKALACCWIEILYWTHFYLSFFKVFLKHWILTSHFNEYFCLILFAFSSCCFYFDWFSYPFWSISLSCFINPQDQAIFFSSLKYLSDLLFSFLVLLNQPLEKLD